MSLRPYRWLGVALGAGVIGWQFVNLAMGRFWHEYLIADLIAGPVLIWASLRAGERSSTAMIVGFSMFLGIFLAATTGKLVMGGVHPGTIAAALAVVPCLVGVIGLGFGRIPGETRIGGATDGQ